MRITTRVRQTCPTAPGDAPRATEAPTLFFKGSIRDEVLEAERTRIEAERSQAQRWGKVAVHDATEIMQALGEAMALLNDPRCAASEHRRKPAVSSTKPCSRALRPRRRHQRRRARLLGPRYPPPRRAPTSSRSRSSPPLHPRAAMPVTWSGCASSLASVSLPGRCCTRAHDRYNSPSGSSHSRSARCGVTTLPTVCCGR